MAATTTRPLNKNGAVHLNGNGHKTVAVVKEEAPSRSSSTGLARKAIIGIGAAVLLSWGAVWGAGAWQFSAAHTSTDDAFVASDTVPITPQVAGNVAQVLVNDNQRVHAGDPLVILDDAIFRADVDQAQANLGVAEANAEGAATN